MAEGLRKIHLLGYSHHDYAWCNTRKWHIWRYIRTFEQTLDIMRDHPDLTLTVDNIDHSVGEFEKYCPGRLDEFKAFVHEGRICVSNGGMALIRPGLFDGEMFIRNAVDGMREFCRLFDMVPEDMPTFWAADVAPGCSQIPQIMRQMGVRLYRFKRSEVTMNLDGVPEVFHWKGLDGSSVIVERTSYSTPWRETFDELNDENWPEMCGRFVSEHLEPRKCRINTDEIIVPFGSDDCLPLKNSADQPVNIGKLMEMWNERESSEMIFSTPNRFLEAVENKHLPTWDGVLDPCELSFNAPFRADRSLWRARFEAERTLLLCERLNAILSAMGGKALEPEEISQLWKRAYEFCGHAMQFLLDEDYARILDSARATVTLIREKCMELEDSIASLAGTGTSRRHVLINPSSFAFDGLCELHITSEKQVQGLRLFDSAGEELPWQLVKIYKRMSEKPYSRPGQYSEVRVVCPVHIAANGYETVFIDFDGDRMPEIAECSGEAAVIDTGSLRFRVEKGIITEVERGGKKVLDGVPLLKLRFVSTNPTDSWYTDFESIGESEFVPTGSRITLNGPYRWEIVTDGTIGSSRAQLVTVIERGNPEVAFRLTLDNREREGFFIADFPCDENPELAAGVPFGEEARDTEKITYTKRDKNVPMSFIDFERGWNGQVWANGYLRMKQGGMDVGVMQGDCDVYYQNVPHSGVVSLLLMKSIDLEARTDPWVRNMSPDTTGAGIQHFRFGFCFADDDPTCCMKAAADRFRLPVIDADRYCLESGAAPNRFSAFSLTEPNVCVTSVQRKADGYHIRMYETTGKACICRLNYAGKVKSAQFCDLLDRTIEKTAELEAESLVFEMKPWEIAALVIHD